jgi:hypothetical protein
VVEIPALSTPGLFSLALALAVLALWRLAAGRIRSEK